MFKDLPIPTRRRYVMSGDSIHGADFQDQNVAVATNTSRMT